MSVPTTIVIPTVGRDSLYVLLESLSNSQGPRPEAIVVVDDRPSGSPLRLPAGVKLLRSSGGGPAAARNCGWRAATTPWVSFLDDDVVVGDHWLSELDRDLSVAIDATQGKVEVPLPTHRRPSDWERSTKSLETAPWITADMSVRRSLLERVGGFDERFRRAYREDSDLAIRIHERGGAIAPGRRCVRHPARTEDFWVSVRQQRGNADDGLMRALHGAEWRTRAGAARGMRRWHVVTSTTGLVALAAALVRERRIAGIATLAWAALTSRLAVRRILPGPRTRGEVSRMAVTSLAIPFSASWWSAVGRLTHRRREPWRGWPRLVLFDRDGTLVEDVPYNGDPDQVRPVRGARDCLDALREAGIGVGVITNQSGVGRGLITSGDVDSVNARIEDLIGPFDTWQVCLHAPEDQCRCRKPEPEMVHRACEQAGISASDCVLIGDIGADVEAAERAGAVGVLVPTKVTLGEEIDRAQYSFDSLEDATGFVLRGRS